VRREILTGQPQWEDHCRWSRRMESIVKQGSKSNFVTWTPPHKGARWRR